MLRFLGHRALLAGDLPRFAFLVPGPSVIRAMVSRRSVTLRS
jgi:hypothetical protein